MDGDFIDWRQSQRHAAWPLFHFYVHLALHIAARRCRYSSILSEYFRRRLFTTYILIALNNKVSRRSSVTALSHAFSPENSCRFYRCQPGVSRGASFTERLIWPHYFLFSSSLHAGTTPLINDAFNAHDTSCTKPVARATAVNLILNIYNFH